MQNNFTRSEGDMCTRWRGSGVDWWLWELKPFLFMVDGKPPNVQSTKPNHQLVGSSSFTSVELCPTTSEGVSLGNRQAHPTTHKWGERLRVPFIGGVFRRETKGKNHHFRGLQNPQILSLQEFEAGSLDSAKGVFQSYW